MTPFGVEVTGVEVTGTERIRVSHKSIRLDSMKEVASLKRAKK